MKRRDWMLEVDIETGRGRLHRMDGGCACRDEGRTPCGGSCGCHSEVQAGAALAEYDMEASLREDNERLMRIMAMMTRHMIVARKVRGH